MNKQSGFTLIELVIVIIILGILAATAVPKFVDLQGDARESAMKGVKGALEGAATLTYSRAAIDGVEKEETGQEVNGINVVFGYPAATETDLQEAAGLSDTDWTISESGTGISGEAIITAAGAISSAAATGGCRVVYEAAADDSSRPTITEDTAGC